MAVTCSLLVSRTLSLAFFSKKRRMSWIGGQLSEIRGWNHSNAATPCSSCTSSCFLTKSIIKEAVMKVCTFAPQPRAFPICVYRVRAVFPDLLPWPQVRLPRSKFCRVLIYSCVRSMSCIMNMNSVFFSSFYSFFFLCFCARPVSAKARSPRLERAQQKKKQRACTGINFEKTRFF